MRSMLTERQKDNEKKYLSYKRLIRNLRGGKLEKINSKKTSNNFTKK